MSSFDAYHKWLGIPPGDQPPNHYRLLGIGVFESDPEVIGNAADSCMGHIRSFQAGEHSDDSQRILNEIARARLCLLNAEKKAGYDCALCASLEPCNAALAKDADDFGFLNAVVKSPRGPNLAAGGRMFSGNGPAWAALAFVTLAAALAIAAVISLQPPRQRIAAESLERQTSSGATPEAEPRAQPETSAEAVRNGLVGTPSVQERTPTAPTDTPQSLSNTAPIRQRGGIAIEDARPAIPIAPDALASPLDAPAWKPQDVSRAASPGGPEDNEFDDGGALRPTRMGKFVTALCWDLRGNLWVGTEDTGVWRYDPGAAEGRRWAQFTRARTGGPPEPDGPVLATRAAAVNCLADDNAYALACDKLGRLWVGHLNHGVSVFNGNQWRNYDVLSGPLGERVFAVKTCPVDGDVWIATSAGLSRYRLDDDTWAYYTRADGLAADEVQCLAFDRKGTLYAGTQCDGLAVCRAVRAAGRLEYKAWRVVAAARAFQDRPPPVPCGEGLPSNLLNDVLVARDGSIYVATTTGLATSRDGGRAWRFVRGQDWDAKARGLFQPPPDKFLKAAADSTRGLTLMLEDYVTCLAEDDAGNLWVGHREKGCELLDPRTGNRVYAGGDLDFPTRLLPDGGNLFVATYGAGLARVQDPALPSGRGRVEASPGDRTRHAPRDALADASPLAPFPLSAAAPSAEEIRAMGAMPSKPQKPPRQAAPLVVALDDDWRTQGDWLGRYWACCSAICSPKDYLWGAGAEPVHYAARIGPHCTRDDSVRYWVHWLYTDNRRSLEMPPTYFHSRIVKGFTPGDKPRRQAEWDDHGETYPRPHEGPDVYCTLKVPAGLFFLSLYDFNKDGHEGSNRFRDFRVSIRAHDPKSPLYDIGSFEWQPELAHARIRDFWGGVWKRFLVRGPSELTIRLSRNYSFCTILAGVMLDLVDEEPRPYFAGHPAAPSLGLPGRWMDVFRSAVDHLDELQSRNPAQWAVCSRPRYVLLLRAGFAEVAESGKQAASVTACAQREIGTSAFFSCLFPEWEQGQAARALTTARNVEKALRWDRTTFSCVGMGNALVGQYVMTAHGGRP